MSDELASHEENVAYYRSSSTEELLRFAPRALADHENTARRLAGILAVLAERGIAGEQ